LKDWQAALEANFLAATELTRAVVDGMVQRRFGRIVNITSLTVRMPVQRLELSNATRLALTGYVASVARQLAPQQITINTFPCCESTAVRRRRDHDQRRFLHPAGSQRVRRA
jgi:3-oxoacyl-[acyl-carrier protein] reductase